jgi:radical SAM superfamily enzyme
MVIHRLTGDPHRDELVAPEWCLNKTKVLAQIKENFILRQTFQGRLWEPNRHSTA